ncbi:N-ATPase subunit AtpR [Sinimarinibacterium sp. CAU 1509]|uniref:N-ATPase subunit AtpR n=1 Tax=Sinimarinibacterium sp. CAU 1509 TaxID=2562283 RepID=UPI00146B0C28|nr:ATP synthase subunit I [Sinimarinibacterium sp. CAU 1509]
MTPWIAAAVFAVLGYGAGWLHFANLARNVALLTGSAEVPMLQALGLAALRFALSGAVLFAAVQFGAPALLTALGGWLLARTIRLRAARRESDAANGTPA